MSASNGLNAIPGWQFVNMFYDAQKQIYYCRLRKLEAKKLLECKEITDSGATMQIAFDNANALAKQS